MTPSSEADQPFAAWDLQVGRCPECQFDWEQDDFEDLVGQCVRGVAVFGAALSRIDPTQPVEEGLWTASRYVWHTVDVLRFGTERLWTLSADPTFGVPSWDENVIAETRSYDQLSPVVGLIALIAAVRAWRTAAMESPHDVSTPHPEAGSICAFDIVQRNAHEVCHHLWDIQRSLPEAISTE
jgi:DinB family protein